MLIRVNETTWVRMETIRKIVIALANVVGKNKSRIAVAIYTDKDYSDNSEHTAFFDTWEDAVAHATRIANLVNFSEAKPT